MEKNKLTKEKLFAIRRENSKNEKMYSCLINGYKFILSKRKNRIVSRKVWYYQWTLKAFLAKEIYHATKNGITYLKLPIKHKQKPDKETLLESRPFSSFHNKLIDGLYSQENKSLQIIKRNAENNKHEIKIENLAKQLKDYKSSLKLRNPKNMLYRIVSYYEDDKQKVRVLREEYVPNITSETINTKMKNINLELSKYNNYHHIALKDKDNKVLALYTRMPYTLGYTA